MFRASRIFKPDLPPLGFCRVCSHILATCFNQALQGFKRPHFAQVNLLLLLLLRKRAGQKV